MSYDCMKDSCPTSAEYLVELVRSKDHLVTGQKYLNIVIARSINSIIRVFSTISVEMIGHLVNYLRQ